MDKEKLISIVNDMNNDNHIFEECVFFHPNGYYYRVKIKKVKKPV